MLQATTHDPFSGEQREGPGGPRPELGSTRNAERLSPLPERDRSPRLPGCTRRDTPPRSRLSIAMVLAVAAACGKTPGMERADVVSYLERTRAWAPVEAETAQVLDRIIATQFVDEAEVNREIAA